MPRSDQLPQREDLLEKISMLSDKIDSYGTKLKDLSIVMSDASICGLGQAATNPLNSIIKHFAGELKLDE